MAWLVRSFLPIGVGLLIFGLVMLVRTVQFVSNAERTTGTVVDVTEETDSDGTEIFYPVVEFTAQDGRTIRFSSHSGSSNSPSTGDRVDVLYDPDNPDDARLAGLLDVWLIVVVPLILGTAFTALGWYLRRRFRTPRDDADLESQPAS